MKHQSTIRYTFYIALLLAFAFLLSRFFPAAVPAFSGGAVYRGKSGTALVCAVRFDANVRELAEQAQMLNVPVTFFIPTELAADKPELFELLRQPPFECGLLGLAYSPETLENELAHAKSAGIPTRFYMPSSNDNAQTLSRELQKRGCRIVLSTFDVLQHTTEPDDIVERIMQNYSGGAIIRFQPAKTMLEAFPSAVEALRESGAELLTLGEMLD